MKRNVRTVSKITNKEERNKPGKFDRQPCKTCIVRPWPVRACEGSRDSTPQTLAPAGLLNSPSADKSCAGSAACRCCRCKSCSHLAGNSCQNGAVLASADSYPSAVLLVCESLHIKPIT